MYLTQFEKKLKEHAKLKSLDCDASSLEVCDYLKILGDRTYTFLPIISRENLKLLKYIDA